MHEGHRAGRAEQTEVSRQDLLQTVQGRDILAVLSEAADPLCSRGVLLKPRVGRGDEEQAAGVDALVNAPEELPRAVQAVDEVREQDEVVARELRLEVARIALEKLDP